MGRKNVHARTSRAGILVTILCGLTATVLPAPCSAQAVYGSIGGTVKDASGAVLPGVTVTIVSNARQTSDSVVTNESGRFVKERLLPGEYKVQAELTGFRMAVVPNVIVGVDAQTPVEFVLDVGQLTEQVEVTGGSTLLTTDRADVSTRFDSKQITDLPVLDRNFTKFILLTPGTQQLRVAACRQREPAGVDADDGERAAFQRHGLPAGRHGESRSDSGHHRHQSDARIDRGNEDHVAELRCGVRAGYRRCRVRSDAIRHERAARERLRVLPE